VRGLILRYAGAGPTDITHEWKGVVGYAMAASGSGGGL